MKEAKSGFNQIIYDALMSIMEDIESVPDLIIHKEKAKWLSDDLRSLADVIYKED